jgi:hypothetical protein
MDEALKQIVYMIQSVGFPIAVSAFLLLDRSKQDKKHGEYIETLTKLNDSMAAINTNMADMHEAIKALCGVKV